MSYNHDNELYVKSQELLENIKRDYGIGGVRMDDVVLTDIRSALIEYSDYVLNKYKNSRKKSLKI